MIARRRVAWPKVRPPRPAPPNLTASRYLKLVTAICRDHGWPTPETELRFSADRRWRFDLAWQSVWLAVEVQGGLFSGGAHVRGAGLLAEYEKLNAAQITGWTVLLVTPTGITNGTLTQVLDAYFSRWYPSRYPAASKGVDSGPPGRKDGSP